MLSFLVRRALTGLATLFTAIFLMFLLVDKAIDPLADLRESTAPNKQQLIDARIQLLDLKTNVVVRFFKWLGHLLTGDAGMAWRTKQAVGPLIAHAIGSTLQLVLAATLMSLVLGVAVGIVSALRQYTTFDYLIIFLSFLLYSLPSFWVGVLLKQWARDRLQRLPRRRDDPVAGDRRSVGSGGLAVDAGHRWPVVRRVQTFVLATLATGGDARVPPAHRLVDEPAARDRAARRARVSASRSRSPALLGRPAQPPGAVLRDSPTVVRRPRAVLPAARPGSPRRVPSGATTAQRR